MTTSNSSVTIIWSPYHTGLRDYGVGDGPNKLKSAGLVHAIEELGIKVDQVTLSPVDNFTGEIGRTFELLRQTSIAVKEATARRSFPLIVAGNCMTSVGAACGLGPDSLSYIVFDTHEDLHTPSTTTSGYFDGMGWPILAGDSFHEIAKTIPGFTKIDLGKQLVLCGVRDCSEAERRLVADYGIDAVWGSTEEKVKFLEELFELLKRSSNSPALVHLDLDVLDESVGKASSFAAPGGLSAEQLEDCMRLIAREREVAALTVASFDPAAGDGDTIAEVAIRAVRALLGAISNTDTGTKSI